jgi:hypothetical protein
MDSELFAMLVESMAILQARDDLMRLKIQDFPNMKGPDRGKLHREVYRLAYPEQKERALGLEEIKKLFSIRKSDGK